MGESWEKEMTKIFHLNIRVKKSKIDALFDFGSKENLIVKDLIQNIILEVHSHPIPYPLYG